MRGAGGAGVGRYQDEEKKEEKKKKKGRRRKRGLEDAWIEVGDTGRHGVSLGTSEITRGYSTMGGEQSSRKRDLKTCAGALEPSDCAPRDGYASTNPAPRVGYLILITEYHSIMKLGVEGVSRFKAISCELLDSSEHYLNTQCVGLPVCPVGVFELMERARIRLLCPTTEPLPIGSIISLLKRPQRPRNSGSKAYAPSGGVLHNRFHIILFSQGRL